MPRKSAFHHGNLRQALTEVALGLLDEAGPDAITIREVARRSRVSHAAPVNHFKDRRTLLTEVAVHLFGQLSDAIQESIGSVASSRGKRIRAFADSLIKFGLSHPERYRMLWRRDLVDNSDPRLAEAMDGIYDALVGEIERLVTAHPIDPHTMAIGLWSTAHGYIALRLDGNFEPAIDAVSGKSRQNAVIEAYLAPHLAPR